MAGGRFGFRTELIQATGGEFRVFRAALRLL